MDPAVDSPHLGFHSFLNAARTKFKSEAGDKDLIGDGFAFGSERTVVSEDHYRHG